MVTLMLLFMQAKNLAGRDLSAKAVEMVEALEGKVRLTLKVDHQLLNALH